MLSLLLPLLILPVLAVKAIDEEAKAEWATITPAVWDDEWFGDHLDYAVDDEWAPGSASGRWKDLIAAGMGDAWYWGPYDKTASIHELRGWFGV